MLDIGIIVTLFIYLIIGSNFTEKKMYWWFVIFGVSIVSLIKNNIFKTQDIGMFIVGCLLADTFVSVIYYVLNGDLFDACFTFVHHLVWAYLLLLYIDDEYVIRNVILGQIFIASVDLCANIIKKVDVVDPNVNTYLHLLNIFSRMFVGNYFIWNVWEHTANDLYLYAGIFNTTIGAAIMMTDNVMDLY